MDSRSITVSLLIVLIMFCPGLAFACSTCGCSEVCPVAMMGTESGGGKVGEETRSSSMVGRMVVKLAYERDEKLQNIAKKLRRTNMGTTAAIAGVAGSTIAQGTTSIIFLNPPSGIQDSYFPGELGLGLNGLTNALFTARILVGHKYRKQIYARQAEIQKQVENVLHHLEFSQMTCPEAQKQLVALIGERGAQDFSELWQASHQTNGNATVAEDKAAEIMRVISTSARTTTE